MLPRPTPPWALPEHGLEWALAYGADASRARNGVHGLLRWVHLWECWVGYEMSKSN